jgi:hypothetical protein
VSDKLKLRAEDAEDLAVIAACLQDARLPLTEMVFQPDAQRFMAAFTRYRWERCADPHATGELTEVAAALVFEEIRAVKYRGLDRVGAGEELGLLTIATEPGTDTLIRIDLIFSGDVHIQLRTDRIRCRLDDFAEPRPASKAPGDHFAGDDG